MKKGKPTVEDIKEQVEKCTTHYSGVHRLFKDVDEKFYNLEFKELLNIPVEFGADAIVTPTSRDVVDTAVNHTDIHNARVFVNKKGTSNRSEESSEMLKKLGLGIIHRTNVESQIAPGHVGAKHFWLHGLAVFKTIWDADRWPDKPAQKEGETEEEYAERLDEWRAENHLSLPIIIQAINPYTIMPDPYYGGQLYVIERHKKLKFDAAKIWPHLKSLQSGGSDDEVEFISYWDKDYRCDLVDGFPILKVKGGVAKHNYGFIPYTLIESGLGNLSIEAKPEQRYVGILRYIKDMLVSESINYTLCNILMKRETLKGGYVTGADAEAISEIKQEYGKYWPVGDKDVQFHDWEAKLAPDAAYRHLALTSDYIASHAAPRSARGMSEMGVRSGSDRRLIMAAASAIYQYASPAFANGWANILSKCAMLVKNVIPGDFEMWTRTPTDEFDVVVRKSLMKEPFNYYVEFAPISEEDEYLRRDSIIKMVGSGLATRNWGRKQISSIDIREMELEEEKQKLKDDPTLHALVVQVAGAKLNEVLTQAGLVPAPPPMQGGGGMAPPGATNRGTVPPIPQRAPLGSAQELENRIKARVGTNPAVPFQGMGGGGNR